MPKTRAPTNLVGIKAGRMTGNWRDSEQGLGRGRYAYDVNAALVPAALEAAARLADSGLLDDYLDAAQRRTLSRARTQARDLGAARAVRFLRSTFPLRGPAPISRPTRRRSVWMASARCARLGEKPLAFHALSLDEQGQAGSDPAFGRRLSSAAHGTARG